MKRFFRFAALAALAVTLVLLTTVILVACNTDVDVDFDVGNDKVKDKVKDPTPTTVALSVDPPAGTIGPSQTISLITDIPGAAIRYTINGAAPTASTGIPYSAPFTLPDLSAAPTTVKAIAYKAGMLDSAVLTTAYTLLPKGTVATPTASPQARAITQSQAITLATATDGATIYYTIDGTYPSPSTSTEYRGPFTLPTDFPVMLQAVAVKADMTASAVMMVVYTNASPLPLPPVSVTATEVSPSSIKVSWSAVPKATGYKVYYALTSWGAKTQVGGTLTGTSYTHTGLTANTTYYYCISAVNSVGEGTMSAPQSGTIYDNVMPIDFSPGTPKKTLDLSGFDAGKQIYLVTVNTSPNSVMGNEAGGVASNSSGSTGSMSRSAVNSADVPPGHHSGAVAFNANPPRITSSMPQESRTWAITRAVISRNIGDKKKFWVEGMGGNWVEIQAELRGRSTYCNIWVMDGLPTNPQQVQNLADKFAQIYPLETKLLGYEYGGGTGGSGGKDGDGRIQILVYNFGQSDVIGFFWSKDFYTQTELNGQGISLKTNLAEIFYINSQYLQSPDLLYSTMVHEFQHMINFNVKYVKNGNNSGTWYDEMCSMIAEDVIDPLIGVAPTNPAHPIAGRISGFLRGYANDGVTTGMGSASYSYKYAFGAYLARNYGGAEFVKNLLANSSTDTASITAALQATAGNPGIDFNYALERFGEAFIFSNTEKATFNKTVTKTIDGTTYTFTGFNIWDNSYGNQTWGGPTIFSSSPSYMLPSSVYVQSSNWYTGSLTSITLNRPTVYGVKLYLMTR
jgi:hypothetical protein